MSNRIISLLAVLAALFWSRAAEASHYRYGTIAWTVQNPQTAPLAVTFTITTAWRATQIGQTNLAFGDGSTSGNVIGAAIGTGADAIGSAYAVTKYTTTHTYAMAGTYTAFFQGGQRIIGLINGANASYRVETTVGLAPGNTGGPVASAPATIQMQTGGVRTYTFPAFDPDGDTVTCRFATSSEMWSSNPGDGPIPPAGQEIPREPIGNTIPTLSSGPTGCVVTWDLTQAAPGKQYLLHPVFESTHGGQVSSTAIDLILETVSAPPPSCVGSGTFIANVAQTFTTSTTATDPANGTLVLNVINAPQASFTSPASGMAGQSPLASSFTWTPPAAFAGTTQIVEMSYTAQNNTSGSCLLTIYVPHCSGFGAACTAGLGECQKSGTTVCAGPGAAVCNAVPGLPVAEICNDALDNDCNGTVDNGCPDPDADGDGLSDIVEGQLGTNPSDVDSDDDGVPDGQEPSPGEDTDGDGKPNALDPDSDDDGLFDGTEMGLGCSNPATDATKMLCISDADLGTTKTDPLDSDTDHGTLKDGVEDANHNGRIDAGETDPNLAEDDAPTAGCATDSECGAASSGKVCDDTTKACIDGCRGLSGNGCPDGQVCSSQSVTVGACSSDGSGGAGGVGGMGSSSNSSSSSSSTSGAGGAGGSGGGGSGGSFHVTCSAAPMLPGRLPIEWLAFSSGLVALVALRRRSSRPVARR